MDIDLEVNVGIEVDNATATPMVCKTVMDPKNVNTLTPLEQL